MKKKPMKSKAKAARKAKPVVLRKNDQSIEISGIVSGVRDYGEFCDKFIDWVEANKHSFGGSFRVLDADEDNWCGAYVNGKPVRATIVSYLTPRPRRKSPACSERAK